VIEEANMDERLDGKILSRMKKEFEWMVIEV
jgi:hypothetical protein